MTANAVVVIGETGADAERLEQLAGYLRAELAEVDGATVERLTFDDVPEGARAIEFAAAGAMIVGLARSQTLKTVVAVVRRWLERSPQPGRSITVRIDDMSRSRIFCPGARSSGITCPLTTPGLVPSP